MECPPCLPVSSQRHSTDRGTYNQVPWGKPTVQPIMEKPHQPCHKKADNILAFLWHNLRQASKETKTKTYFTMVRSNIDYCHTIWSPYKQDSKHQAEMVHRRAARFVTRRYRNTSCVIYLLNHLEWETHEIRRSKLQLTELFKMLYGLIDVPPSDYLTPVMPAQGQENRICINMGSTLHPLTASRIHFPRQYQFGTKGSCPT